jgi:hypothetical protein
MSEEKTTHHLICMGLVQLVGGILGVAFIRHEDAEKEDPKRHLYAAKKRMRNLVVGGVYELEGNADLTSIVASPRFSGMYRDEPRVAAWRTASEAVEVVRRAESKEKAAKRYGYLEDLLEPIRREYRKAMGLERLAIELRVLTALRRITPAEERRLRGGGR